MSKVMYMLDERKLLPKPPRGTAKRWSGCSEIGELPWYSPLPQRKYEPDPLHGKEDILEAEIATFPDFERVPMDIAAREIRLLGIYPTPRPEDPLIVNVVYVPMRTNVNFHALSYVWGSPKITRYLKNWNMRLGVTENLFSALQALRNRMSMGEGPIYIWVDAVCIDQSNEAEKAWTIARMHDIFEAANIVQICIAPSYLLTSRVAELLEGVAVDKIGCVSERPVDQLASLEAWADLYALFRLPYFGRRWIVQELASASAPHVMMGGHHPRALRTISIAASVMQGRFPELLKLWIAKDHPILRQCRELSKCVETTEKSALLPTLQKIRHQFQRVQRIDHIRHLRMRNEPPSFLFLAILTQSSRCADPRDVLSSLWNICREKSTSVLPLQHEKTIDEFYIAFTKFYAFHTSSLDIMCVSQSELKRDQDERLDTSDWQTEMDLPSWCPDYRQGGNISSMIRYEFITFGIRSWPSMDFAPFHADRVESAERSSPCFRFVNDSLIAQGVVLDTVKYICDTPFNILPWSDISGLDFESLHWDWINAAMSGVSKSSEGSIKAEAFDNRIFADLLNMMVGEVGTIEVSLDGTSETGTWNLTRKDNSPYSHMATFSERAAAFTKGRRLIVTKNGYVGLVPPHTKKGYKIAILLGCSVPVLLQPRAVRKAERNERSRRARSKSPVQKLLQFRGDCFIQHWMHGQMMKRYAETTEEAWKIWSGPDFEICIQ